MFYSSLRFSQNGSEQEAGGCEVSYGGWALGGQAWWKWNNKVDQCPSKDWRDSSAWWNSCMYLCSPSQNSVPLHLARHAVASTDGMFFEGKPHSRAKGTPAPPTPPAVPWSSHLAPGVQCMPWKSLCAGGACGCNREQIHAARPQRARSRDGWMFGEWNLGLLIYAL